MFEANRNNTGVAFVVILDNKKKRWNLLLIYIYRMSWHLL